MPPGPCSKTRRVSTQRPNDPASRLGACSARHHWLALRETLGATGAWLKRPRRSLPRGRRSRPRQPRQSPIQWRSRIRRRQHASTAPRSATDPDPALVRRLAIVRVLAGDPPADDDLVRATSTLSSAVGDPAWRTSRAAARDAAEAGDDHRALAELLLLDALDRLQASDLEGARAAAHRARVEALAAPDPVTYVAASMAVSGTEEAAGDHVAAYGALAAGWASLADLVGAEVAASVWRPILLATRQRWGAVAFANVKTLHDDRRRQARGGAVQSGAVQPGVAPQSH